MVKRFLVIVSVVVACATLAWAQNTNSSTTQSTRTRTVAPKPSPTPKPKSTDSEATTSTKKRIQAAGQLAPSSGVLAAFNSLLEGIRHSNVDTVSNVYWHSPQLILFNRNGSVTRGWEQMRQNRVSSYPETKDVKLDVRDLRVLMLGRDGALVTCFWTQSQTFRGTPETSTGRMTIVFRRSGREWKAVHLHTSPDAATPGRVMPSEQAPTPTPENSPRTQLSSTQASETRQEDPGVDIAYVTAVKANLREMPDSVNVVLQPTRGDLLALIDRTPRGTWYNVIHVRSGKEGWIDGSVINIKYTEKPRPAPVFEERRVASNTDPALTIQNQTDRALTLRLGDNLYGIAANSERSVTVSAGTYKFYGSVPNAYPTFGQKDFPRGIVYTWRFFISTEGR